MGIQRVDVKFKIYNMYNLDLRERCESHIPISNIYKYNKFFESLKLTAVNIIIK
jgi:hypothetical protein